MNFHAVLAFLRQYLLAAICGALLALLLIVLVARGGKLAGLKATESELDSRIAAIDRNAKQAVNLEQHVERAQTAVEEIEKALFRRRNRAININFFYETARRTPVTVAAVQAKGPVAGNAAQNAPNALKRYARLVYEIDVTGSFAGVVRFMDELAAREAHVRVGGVSMSQTEDAAAGGGVLEVRMKVFVLAKQAEDSA